MRALLVPPPSMACPEWCVDKLLSGGPGVFAKLGPPKTAQNHRSLGQSAVTPQERGRLELRTLKACLTDADRVHVCAAF